MTRVPCILVALLAAMPCLAQPGVPPSPQGMAATSGNRWTAVGHGLRMTVDGRLAAGLGYRPIRIQFTPLAPVTADRMLRVELALRVGYRRDRLRVAQEVEIPAGSGIVDMTVSLPPFAQDLYCNVIVYEDGDLLPQLSLHFAPNFSLSVHSYGSLAERAPLLLMVGDHPPDLSELSGALNLAQSNNPQGIGPIAPPYAQQQESMLALPCAPADLCARWIDYTSLDVVCVSLDELATLRSSGPAAFQAILDWTSAGGNLWVYGLGDDWRRLGELETLAKLTPNSDSAEPIQRGWMRQAASGDNPEYKEPSDQQDAANPQPPRFVLRPLGMGMVVAFATDKPFPGTMSHWQAVLAAMGSERWRWPERHGLVPGGHNPEFWNFLIPGAGVAPVKTFGLLITLFVVGIGPVNYWFLRRKGRLYLLLLTTPAIAAALTLLLFAYAIVADGLDVRVRARSVTELDQRSGHAACWTRLCYCAGMAPRGGLRFPADVAVLPLESTFNDRRSDPPRREVVWDGDQRLAAGWLAARTPAQFVTIRSRASEAGLDLLDHGRAANPSLRNRLGTPLRQLLVETRDGKHYWAEDVEEGATVELKPIEAAPAMQRLRDTYESQRLTLPEELAAISQNPYGFSGTRHYSRYPVAAQYQRSGRLERALAALAGADGLQSPLAPGSYVAIVDRSPEVVFGVPAAKEEEGYHVVFGKW